MTGRIVSPATDCLRACLRPEAPAWARKAAKAAVQSAINRHPNQPGAVAEALGIERRTWERLRAEHEWIGSNPKARG